eukprot:COSAG01_NODE_5282_length_4358_cov_16.208734_3_plen_63_part_00
MPAAAAAAAASGAFEEQQHGCSTGGGRAWFRADGSYPARLGWIEARSRQASRLPRYRDRVAL